MNKHKFFPSLALTNIKNNRRFYIPYILAGMCTVAMSYIILFISTHPGLNEIYGGSYLKSYLFFGVIIIGIFSTVILFYTNSFLMKRRKKELGLFCVLGMEKRHLAKIQLYETLMIAALSIAAGLFCGILLSKLILLLLFKLVHLDVPFGFHISGMALGLTSLFFCPVYLLTLFANLIRVGRAKPLELLRGGQVGQKEPRTKWGLTIIGILALGGGYTIAIVTQSPINAIALFFIAVILVILGTYCLFTAGSIATLKLLRNNKRYYYQTKHFTSVSGMIYRMRQNAVGLANICILSTMVLVTISTTVALYASMEDHLNNRYPRDISVTIIQSTETPFNDSTLGELRDMVQRVAKEQNLKITQLNDYQMLAFNMERKGDAFTAAKNNYISDEASVLLFITSLDYEKQTGNKVSLEDDEVLLYSNKNNLGEIFTLLGQEYQVKEKLESFPVSCSYAPWVESFCFVVADELILRKIYEKQVKAYPDGFSIPEGRVELDLEGTATQILGCYEKIRDAVYSMAKKDSGMNGESSSFGYSIECREEASIDLYALYGGFLFLGISLGVLFLMATILIIFYKQITEGYDDKARFAIMQQVGMSLDEVKRTIRSQVLTVFFLPLVAAGVHIAFAFSIITKMLAALGLTNVALFAWCTAGTIAIFAVVYAIVYALTARTYYRIVSYTS